MSFLGEIETHITLALSEPEQVSSLAQWSQERNLKCVHIVLERGFTSSQPMLTRHGIGTLEDQLLQAYDLKRDCENCGFPVSRVKLEVAPWNRDVPQTPIEAQTQPAERYFEHHIKLLLSANAKVSDLIEFVVQQGAHFSRNARRVREDEQQERFVTQRCRGVCRSEASDAFNQLVETLSKFPFPILETEEEFVVYDSNLALDAGWLDETIP